MRAVDAVNIAELRAIAKRRLPRFVFDYVDGGAEDERTLAGNRDAFERLRFAPRTLVDVAERDLSCRLLGAQIVIVGLEIFGRRPGHPLLFHTRKLQAKGRGDFPAHLVLDGEHAGNATVEPVRPQVVAGFHVDQLRIEADLLAGPANAAFDDEADAFRNINTLEELRRE